MSVDWSRALPPARPAGGPARRPLSISQPGPDLPQPQASAAADLFDDAVLTILSFLSVTDSLHAAQTWTGWRRLSLVENARDLHVTVGDAPPRLDQMMASSTVRVVTTLEQVQISASCKLFRRECETLSNLRHWMLNFQSRHDLPEEDASVAASPYVLPPRLESLDARQDLEFGYDKADLTERQQHFINSLPSAPLLTKLSLDRLHSVNLHPLTQLSHLTSLQLNYRGDPGDSYMAQHLATIQSLHPTLTSLAISRRIPPSEWELLSLPNLRTFVGPFGGENAPGEIAAMQVALPRVENLTVHHVRVEDAEALARFEHLKELQLGMGKVLSVGVVPEETSARIAHALQSLRSAPTLEEFTLYNVPQLGRRLDVQLLLESCPQLTRLTLENHLYVEFGFLRSSIARQLKWLSLTTSRLSREDADSLPRCESLEKLGIYASYGPCPWSDYLARFHSPAVLPRLEEFSFAQRFGMPLEPEQPGDFRWQQDCFWMTQGGGVANVGCPPDFRKLTP
jgi:hypothetical protein